MVTPSLAELLNQARAWAESDPEPETARQLRDWIDAANEQSLRECFDLPLEFGTAGIRGVVGPGPGQMNLAVIRRVTKAFADHLAENGPADKPVVVAGDARLDSARFVAETTAVLLAAGRSVLQFIEPVPTPTLAFAVLEYQAAAGIMVTASHNPPEYNGYKVYGHNAIQIVNPVDTQVAERMKSLPPARDIRVMRVAQSVPSNCEVIGAECIERYEASVLKSRPKPLEYPLRIAYTPLHGVGWAPVQSLFRKAGYGDLQPVPTQVKPDGQFPTVNFPNPEEPGTLNQGIRFATDIGAQLLLANDPDADRLAMALPDDLGQWHALTGNQLGIVLMDYLLDRARQSTSVFRPLVITTLVSTPMADVLARAFNARIERTLTGFKWLWTATLELLKDKELFLTMAWEEALGYSTHPAVRDKDGVAAALVAADWAAACHAAGVLPWARLGQLYRQHGAWASRQHNVYKPGASGVKEIREALQRLSHQPPSEVDGLRVVEFEDYRNNLTLRPIWRGNSELFILQLADQSRVLVRPSGTEPKLKVYVDVSAEIASSADPFEVLQTADGRADRIGRQLVKWMGL